MDGTTPRRRRLLMLLAGLFGLVTTVASALPGGAAAAPESSATASGLPGQDCASHCAQRAAQDGTGRERAARRPGQERAVQRSEALKAGAALFHRYYAAVISRYETRPGLDTARPALAAARAAGPGPAEAPAP
ncbi:hypothetical protein AB0J52_41090, partial [Spirillospora sp. NPDC049652]